MWAVHSRQRLLGEKFTPICDINSLLEIEELFRFIHVNGGTFVRCIALHRLFSIACEAVSISLTWMQHDAPF